MNNEHKKRSKRKMLYCAPGLKPCAQNTKKRNEYTLKEQTNIRCQTSDEIHC
jgi:hypothetical protein